MINFEINVPKLSNNFALSKDLTGALKNRSEEFSEQAARLTLDTDHGFEIAKNVFEVSQAMHADTSLAQRCDVGDSKHEIKFNSEGLSELKAIKNQINALATVYLRQSNSKMKPRDDKKHQITFGNKDSKHEVYLATNGKLAYNSGKPRANDLLKLSYDGKDLQELFYGSINKALQLDNHNGSKSLWFKPATNEIVYGSMKKNKAEGVFAIQDTQNNLNLVNYNKGKQVGDVLTLTASGLLILNKANSEDQIVLFPNEDIFQGKIDEQGQLGQGVVVSKAGTCLIGNFSQDQNKIETLKSTNLIEQGDFDQNLYLQGQGTKIFPANSTVDYVTQIEAEWGDVLATEIDAKVTYANGLVYQGKLIVKPDTETIFFDDAYLLGDVIPNGKAKLALEKADKKVFSLDADFNDQGCITNGEGQIEFRDSLEDFAVEAGQLKTSGELKFRNDDLTKMHPADLYKAIQRAIIPDFAISNHGLNRTYANGLKISTDAGWQQDKPNDGRLLLEFPDNKTIVLELKDGEIVRQAEVFELPLTHKYKFHGIADIVSSKDNQRTPSVKELLANEYELLPNGKGELRAKTFTINGDAIWHGSTPEGAIQYNSKAGSFTADIKDGKICTDSLKLKMWLMPNRGRYSGEVLLEADTDLYQFINNPTVVPHGKGKFQTKTNIFDGSWENSILKSARVFAGPRPKPVYSIDGNLLSVIAKSNEFYSFDNSHVDELAKELRQVETKIEKALKLQVKKKKERDTQAFLAAAERAARGKPRTPKTSMSLEYISAESILGGIYDNADRETKSKIAENMLKMIFANPENLERLNNPTKASLSNMAGGNVYAKLLPSIFGDNQKHKIISEKEISGIASEDLKTSSFKAENERMKQDLMKVQSNQHDFVRVRKGNLVEVFAENEDRLKIHNIYVNPRDLPSGFDPKEDDLPDLERVLIETYEYEIGDHDPVEFFTSCLGADSNRDKLAKSIIYSGPIVNGKPDSSNYPNKQFLSLVTHDMELMKRHFTSYKEGEMQGPVTIFYEDKSNFLTADKVSFTVVGNMNNDTLDKKYKCYISPACAAELEIAEDLDAN